MEQIIKAAIGIAAFGYVCKVGYELLEQGTNICEKLEDSIEDIEDLSQTNDNSTTGNREKPFWELGNSLLFFLRLLAYGICWAIIGVLLG